MLHELLTVLEVLHGSRGGESASLTAASRSQHAGGRKFLTSLSLLRALPWRKFKKGSTLVIELGGEVITFFSSITLKDNRLCPAHCKAS